MKRYEDELDGFGPEYEDAPEGGVGPSGRELETRRLSRRERRKKQKLEQKLRRLEAEEGVRNDRLGEEQGAAGTDGEETPRRRSKFAEIMMSLLSGNILSRGEVSKTYPYLLFVSFLAFLYIGNIFSMQRLHRQQSVLTKEVRELRTKSMTLASQRMQATRQSNIINEIEKRGLPLRESLTPNKVIPK